MVFNAYCVVLCCVFVFIRLVASFSGFFHFWLPLRCSLTFVTHEAKDRVTRNPLTTGNELCSCSTGETHRGTLVTNAVISHEWVKDRNVFATNNMLCSELFFLMYVLEAVNSILWWILLLNYMNSEHMPHNLNMDSSSDSHYSFITRQWLYIYLFCDE